MDIKSGESRQWTEADSLDPQSVSLSADEKTLFYLDGDTLVSAGKRTRAEYRVESGWQPGGGLSLADDTSMATLVERRSGRHGRREQGNDRDSPASQPARPVDKEPRLHAPPRDSLHIWRFDRWSDLIWTSARAASLPGSLAFKCRIAKKGSVS